MREDYSGTIRGKRVSSRHKYIIYCPHCGVVSTSPGGLTATTEAANHSLWRHPIKTLLGDGGAARVYGNYRGAWVDVTSHNEWRKAEGIT